MVLVVRKVPAVLMVFGVRMGLENLVVGFRDNHLGLVDLTVLVVQVVDCQDIHLVLEDLMDLAV